MSLALLTVVYAAVSPTGLDARSVYDRIQAGVVTVRTTQGTGSGFVIGDGTLVVTCQHVVKKELGPIKVLGQPAEILVENASKDVAVLRVAKKAGKPLTFATQLPKPGTKIYALGNPLGVLEKTISEGIVSAVRKVRDLEVLQITAPVSEGSSGGPVVDENGRVVGMVRAGITEGQALNFAVGAVTLRQFAQSGTQIAKTRPAKRPVPRSTPGPSTSIQKLQKAILRVSANEAEADELTRFGSAAIPHVIKALEKPGSDGGDANGYLVMALADFGAAAKAPMIAALTKGTPRQRRAIAGLFRLTAEATSNLSSLWADDPDMRKMFDAKRKGTFQFIDDDEVKQALLKAFKTYDADLGAGEAVKALGYLGGKDFKAEILAGASTSDSYVATSVFEALISLLETDEVEDAKRAFDTIFTQTKEEDLSEEKYNRRVERMADSLKDNRTAVGAAMIVHLLGHSNWEVRYEMCNLLVERVETSALPAIKKLLEDEDERIRWMALAAVGNVGRGEMLDRMAAYAKSSGTKDREWGVYAAGLTRSAGGMEIVLSRLTDPEASVRAEVAHCLRYFTDPKATAALKKLAIDPDADVRKAAKETLESQEDEQPLL
jgi:S1-C subfamily serine protease/HEAT repeat protein